MVRRKEIDAALNATPGYGGEHQIVISREAAMDELLLRVEPTAVIFAGGADGLARFRNAVERAMLKTLGIRVAVDLAAPGSLPRTDFKARRVVDDRAVFRELNARIRDGAAG